MKIRPPAVAGTFYPSDPEELERLIKGFLDKVKLPEIKNEIKAIIVPHAGLVYSGRTAAYGYATLKDTPLQRSILKRKNFILIGPSHRVSFSGVAQDTHDFWETPMGKLKVKSQKSKVGDLIVNDKRPHMEEHCLEVQLPFLQIIMSSQGPRCNIGGRGDLQKLRKASRSCRVSVDCHAPHSAGLAMTKKQTFTITPLLTGFGFDYERLAESLRLKAKSCGSILIVSSDLSHYHSQDAAEKIDKKTIKAILNLDIKTLEKEECEACGKMGILTVVSLAKKLGWKPELLHYETSGDVTGDFSQVVGYASISFEK